MSTDPPSTSRINSPALERFPVNVPTTLMPTVPYRIAKAAGFSQMTARAPEASDRRPAGTAAQSKTTPLVNRQPVRSTSESPMFMISMNSKSLEELKPAANSAGVGSSGW